MVVFSIGEHVIMPVKSTISLDLAKSEKGGASLGVTSALSQLGNITGFVLVTALFFYFGQKGWSGSIRFKIVFAAAVVLMASAVLTVISLQETKLKAPRRRFYFAKKFSTFYMLEVFYGARKQIFLTFAPYVLILKYGADTSVISLLLAISAGFGFIFSPLLGKLIDRVGYKFVMVADTLVLVIVCLLYGFAHWFFPPHIAFYVVCVNYILDAIISLASMASNVYVKDLASSQAELTATLSTGISVNHFISILIALLGGWIWERTGIEVLFSLSAFLGILNSVFAATIKTKSPVAAKTA
jgi:MFS family permease